MVNYKYFDLFLKNSIPKQIMIEFDGIVLTNDDLYNQEITLEESLCSTEELVFGSCEASVLKFKISNIFLPMAGKWLDVKMVVNGYSDEPFSIGRYKVNSDKITADRKSREIVAYDAMYDIINSSAISWYNKILPDENSWVTMRQFRKSFIESFGLKEEEITLANDDMIIEKTIEVEEGMDIENETEQVSILKESALSGKTIITSICEINGCFGHIGRDGKFHYIYLPQDIGGLYPSDDLFPDHAPEHLKQSNTGHLYPQDPDSFRIGRNNYIGCDWENYFTNRITKLQIRNGENEIGKIWPKEEFNPEDNCYIIEDNFLVYGKSDGQLQEIARNIFEKITDIVYMPFSGDVIGNPCLEVGDPIRIPTEYDIVESYILQRTLKGIQALRDNLRSDGVEKYSEKVNSVQSSIIQLKGKTNTLVRNVEKTMLEMKDMGDDLSNTISITAEETRREIKDTKEGLETTISETAKGINETIKDTKEGLETRISKTVKGVEMSVSNDKTGKTAEVKLLITDEGGTQYEVTADKIDFTGLVSFTNLSDNDGKTVINGGNITTGSINADLITVGTLDGERINTKTLYLTDGLKFLYTDFDGTKKVRKAIFLEMAENQPYPDLIVGGTSALAGIVMKNSLHCENDAQFSKRVDFDAGTHFWDYIHVDGGIRLRHSDDNGEALAQSINAIYKDGNMHDVVSVDSDQLTTGIGWNGNSGGKTYATVLKLRGKTVTAPNNGGLTIQSDERLKNSFKSLEEFAEVYMDIEPCAFKYNNGSSGRFHFGVKAQNVKESFEKHGYTTKDFGGFVQMAENQENEDYCGIDDPMGIIYTEFVMWNMHMIQKLYKKIEEQKKEIQSLKDSISFLKERIG